jgi:hypothetical protein
MNLKSVSESKLREDTGQLVTEERRIGLEVLHHLKEIDQRKLFAKWGYSSLYQYCQIELKYAGGSAHRRISSMKLLREVPDFESKLKDGTVNATTLSQVHGFLVQEKRQLGKTYSVEKKTELLKQIEDKSEKQTERLLATLSPQLAKPEMQRAMNSEETEIRFTADKALMEKLGRLKNLMGHQTKTYAELFEKLADMALKKHDPMEKKSFPVPEMESLTRYIPAKVKTAVWQRDQGRCTYPGCNSSFGLQYEHVIPFAKGGKSSLENLKLLCPAHNQFTAIEAYGIEKMRQYFAKWIRENLLQTAREPYISPI